MLWLAQPEHKRVPRMQRDIALKLGLAEPTISNWKRLPGFGDAVLDLARELIRSSDLAQILYAQIRKAKKGDTPAARFVFEAAGAMPKEPVATVNIDNRKLAVIEVIYVDGNKS